MAERTPDGHVQLWLLYRPEPFEVGSDDDRGMHLWVRRTDVFSSRQRAVDHLAALIGRAVRWKRHEQFPELEVGYSRGRRWFLCPVPLDPPGGQ